MKKILNIAAGKCIPIDMPDKDFFLVNLDIMYANPSNLAEIEIKYKGWMKKMNGIRPESEVYSTDYLLQTNIDVFKFMELVSFKFDEITCYRFLEHVERDRVLYFIYLISSCLEIGGTLDIVVPDYDNLCQRVLDENPGFEDWEAHDILVTTEIVNHPSDPHASLWTTKRLKYFFGIEGRFKTIDIIPYYMFDGRDIYIRYRAERKK